MHKGFKGYTSGIFAKKAGVTQKTIHHYDKEGLLSPSGYSEAGYRLYTEKDFEKLQKILTLKYVGFSLEEIRHMIERDEVENDIKRSLAMQKELIDEKINHLKLVKRAIIEADTMLEAGEEFKWNSFVNIINMIDIEKVWMQQYKNSSNLAARIKLHDKFSTNKQGWFFWFFDLLGLNSGESILELGCGNASLWLRNVDRIPKNCKITLTDVTSGMVEDAKKNLGDYKNRFIIGEADAQSIPYMDDSFDVVIADHMFYLIGDRKKALSEINRVMKPGGRLYISTIGSTHLKELKQLLTSFKTGLQLSDIDFSEEFGLENGGGQIDEFFSNNRQVRYHDSLEISEVEALVDYVASTSGNAGQLLQHKRSDFEDFIKDILRKTGKIKISKDTGVFIVNKI